MRLGHQYVMDGFLYQADGNVHDRGTVGLVEVVSDTSWGRG